MQAAVDDSGCESETSSSLSSSSTDEGEASLICLSDPSIAEGARLTLLDYFHHLNGACPSLRRRQNNTSTLGRITGFLRHLASTGGEIIDAELTILRHHKSFDGWLEELHSRELKPTTIQNYLLDVAGFIRYLIEFEPVVLRRSHLKRLRLKLSKALKSHRRALTLHRQEMFNQVQDRLISGPQLCALLGKLRTQMAPLLDLFEAETTHFNSNNIASRLAVYLTSYNGCRRGTLINLRSDALDRATVQDGIHQKRFHPTARFQV